MAKRHSTLGSRSSQSNFLAKNKFFKLSEALGPSFLSSIDDKILESMETMREQVNALLRLPLTIQEKSTLVKCYWELEFLVEEMRLLLELRQSQYS